jgi:hypothetical protein
MIREPAFENRRSLKYLLQRAEARMAAGERVPDLELAMIIEQHPGKALPASITAYLTRHFRGEQETHALQQKGLFDHFVGAGEQRWRNG